MSIAKAQTRSPGPAWCWVIAALVVSCVGCGGDKPQTGSAANGTSAAVDAAEGTSSSDPADPEQPLNPVCRLFSQAEVGDYIGEPVLPPQDAALGCQWAAADGSGDVIVAVLPSENHEPPEASTGYRELSDPGTGAFAAPYMDGWLAGAITGAEALRVSVAGSGAGEASAVALLRDVATRRQTTRAEQQQD